MATKRITSAAIIGAAFIAALATQTSQAATPGALFVTAGSQLTPVAVSVEGDSGTYANLDAGMHSVTSTDIKPNGRPLFDSGMVGAAEIVTVKGIEDLEAGTYEYICAFHASMTGQLIIVESIPGNAD